MPIPQVTDRIKEAPAVALRAVFAGIGQFLMAVDKIRAQMQEQATSWRRPRQQQPSAKPPPPGQADGASKSRCSATCRPHHQAGRWPERDQAGRHHEGRCRDQACRRAEVCR